MGTLLNNPSRESGPSVCYWLRYTLREWNLSAGRSCDLPYSDGSNSEGSKVQIFGG